MFGQLGTFAYSTNTSIQYVPQGQAVWYQGWGGTSGSPAGVSLTWSNSGTVTIPTVNAYTQSTSTNTGALTVAGGVGVGGAVYIGQTSYIAGAQILTTATLLTFNTGSVSSIIAGTDTSINSSTGVVTIWNTSTLQSITSRGSSTNYAISITNTSSSTSTNTGALIITGGIGVGGGIFVGGTITSTNIIVSGTATSTSTTTGALQVAGGVGISGTVWIGGNLNLSTATQIIGDFDNNTVNNRTVFTTRTPNANPGIYVVPNGTATAASWQASNNSSLTNASKILIATNGTIDVQLVSGINGTGTYLPLSFYNGGIQQMVLGTTGTLTINTGSLYVGGNVVTTGTTTILSTASSNSTISNALTVPNGSVGVGQNVYVGNRVGWGSSTGTSVAYQFYNQATGSMDLVFG